MVPAEFKAFLITAFIIALSFILGIVVFFRQFIKRKKLHNFKEKLLADNYAEQLLKNQLVTQQNTMAEIGRELHDSVGQQLVLATMYAQSNNYNAPQVVGLLNKCIDDLRALSKTLTIDFVHNIPIEDIFLKEKEKLETLTQFKVHFKQPAVPIRLTNFSKKIAVYRIFQEFLQNSLKYAKAANFYITLENTNENVTVTIADDGIGFNQTEVANKPTTGIGLLNMQQRAESISATFTLTSKPNNGTALQLIIPADHEI